MKIYRLDLSDLSPQFLREWPPFCFQWAVEIVVSDSNQTAKTTQQRKYFISCHQADMIQ